MNCDEQQCIIKISILKPAFLYQGPHALGRKQQIVVDENNVDTSSNDNSSTTKFLSNYQFIEKSIRQMFFVKYDSSSNFPRAQAIIFHRSHV